MTTLSHILAHRSHNNFTAIRFVGAVFVIITHSFILLPGNEPDYLSRFTGSEFNLGKTGLIAFFFMSGLLVCQSLFTSTSVKNFLWKRFLRIYPALWVLVLFMLFGFGLIATENSWMDYFRDKDFWEYLWGSASLLYLQFDLPGVFENNFHKGVNGSLWTLPIELKLYIALLIVYLTGLLRKNIFPFIVLLLLFIQYTVSINGSLKQWHIDEWIHHVSLGAYLNFGIYFCMGALYYLYRSSIKTNYYWLLFFTIVWLLLFQTNLRQLLDYLYFPYLFLHLSALYPKMVAGLFPKGDYSYGLYVYSFPVQQSIIYFSPFALSPELLILLSLIITFPFAYCSWNYVEKRALKWKNKIT